MSTSPEKTVIGLLSIHLGWNELSIVQITHTDFKTNVLYRKALIRNEADDNLVDGFCKGFFLQISIVMENLCKCMEECFDNVSSEDYKILEYNFKCLFTIMLFMFLTSSHPYYLRLSHIIILDVYWFN